MKHWNAYLLYHKYSHQLNLQGHVILCQDHVLKVFIMCSYIYLLTQYLIEIELFSSKWNLDAA